MTRCTEFQILWKLCGLEAQKPFTALSPLPPFMKEAGKNKIFSFGSLLVASSGYVTQFRPMDKIRSYRTGLSGEFF